MSAEAVSRAPMMSLQDLYRLYTSIAAKPGTPVPLSAFNLSQLETERLFSIFDEDYHISRYFHFTNEHGHKYSVNGEEVTHLVIDPSIRNTL